MDKYVAEEEAFLKRQNQVARELREYIMRQHGMDITPDLKIEDYSSEIRRLVF